MARSRAILHDPDRRLISDTLMDAQVLGDETAHVLADILRRHVQASKAARRAQQRLTAAETRAERDCWDGESCRRRSGRRATDRLVAA